MYAKKHLNKRRGRKHSITPQITNMERPKRHENYEIPQRLKILLERPTVSLEEQIRHSWNKEDCSENIFVETNGLTAHRTYARNNTDCIRGKVGFTKGLHVWEITWPSEQRGTHAYVGIATSDATLQCMGYQSLLGLDSNSWGFDINRGMTLHDSIIDTYPKKQNGRERKSFEKFKIKFETIKVILDMDKGTLSFLANGQYFGEAFEGLQNKTLYPIISTVWGRSEVKMEYLGGLESKPITLQELCKYTICKGMCSIHFKENVKLFQLPKSIENYLCLQGKDFWKRSLNTDRKHECTNYCVTNNTIGLRVKDV